MLIAPFMGAFFRARVKSGKENPDRIQERFARALPERANGRLIWFHAASVGESQLLLELNRHLIRAGIQDPQFLYTCQTSTAAELISRALRTSEDFKAVKASQFMAPIDAPGVVKRFIKHWKPDLVVVAEGDIWPNTIRYLAKDRIPHVLVNARMTEKSIRGWMRWKTSARRVFGGFSAIIAADLQTKTGLEALSGQTVLAPGNLKSALPAPRGDVAEHAELAQSIGDRQILLAASTHKGEEAIMIDALLKIQPRPFLIIAPRHPDRSEEIKTLLRLSNLSFSQRSKREGVSNSTDVLLADTIGEMGLWYGLADTVYLGGGHAPGVGGHNPLEALRLGKPVITGPGLFNFKDLSERLEPFQGYSIVDDAEEIAALFPAPKVSEELTRRLDKDALGPMQATLSAIQPIFNTGGS